MSETQMGAKWGQFQTRGQTPLPSLEPTLIKCNVCMYTDSLYAFSYSSYNMEFHSYLH